MTFVKGKSGNPGGLTAKEVALKQSIRKLAGNYAKRAIERLAELMEQNDEPNIARAACDAILDRSVGKAAQAVDVQGDITISVNLKK